MVAQHESDLRIIDLLLMNLLSWIACAKELSILICWYLVKLLRKGSENMSTDWRYCWYLFQARVCFELVPGPTAPFEADSAAEQSLRK